MLNFAIKPDSCFKSILNDSFLTVIDVITQEKLDPEILEGLLPNAAAVYSIETALKTLEKLKDLNNREDDWKLNEFHFVLIYDALDYYCYWVNQVEEENRRLCTSSRMVLSISFNDLVNKYFPHPDFEYFHETFNEKNINFRRKINPAAWKIINRIKPTLEELELKPVIKPSNINKGRLKRFSSGPRVFSDPVLA